jgi:hypothetical protein
MQNDFNQNFTFLANEVEEVSSSHILDNLSELTL